MRLSWSEYVLESIFSRLLVLLAEVFIGPGSVYAGEKPEESLALVLVFSRLLWSTSVIVDGGFDLWAGCIRAWLAGPFTCC